MPAGPTASPHPLVILESGAFGFSADWAAVQERLAAAGFRSLAYDRAGLGLSDPAPEPRDSAAIVADLESLLTGLGEKGPWILCGHSMAGLHARLFCARHPTEVAGLVLVDAAAPEAMDSATVRTLVGHFARGARLAVMAARAGLLGLAAARLGDAIGLTGAASEEKRRAFADPAHTHWAAREVAAWPASAAQARAAGGLDANLPVAVVLAGPERGRGGWQASQTVPARISWAGSVTRVEGATHATILGPAHAAAVVEAVKRVAEVGMGRGG